MTISVILTVHNEGDELRRTIESIKANTQSLTEILIVDEASTDGCCDGLNDPLTKIIRHQHRIGVAYSRHEGATLAKGEVLTFLDGHQRLSANCLDQTASLAAKKNAIVSPAIKGFEKHNKVIHSAFFRLCPDKGFFSAGWNLTRPWKRFQKSNALRAPGYSIPRKLYQNLKWIHGMKGWGGSEALLSIKAFFTKTPILYMRDPIAYHLFRTQFHYDVQWEEIWFNHALIARVCFDDQTWKEYWLPEVFSINLTEDQMELLNSDDVMEQQSEFKFIKRRSDFDFWKYMLKPEPAGLFSSLINLKNNSRIIYEH